MAIAKGILILVDNRVGSPEVCGRIGGRSIDVALPANLLIIPEELIFRMEEL
jgi:hypothetical protein